MNNILKNFYNDFKDLKEYYIFLVNKLKKQDDITSINFHLYNNFNILLAHKNTIKKIKFKNTKKINKIYLLLKDICIKYNFHLEQETLFKELNKYQLETEKKFSYQEINAILPLLTFLYFEKLNKLYLVEHNKLIDREVVSQIIASKNKVELKDFIIKNYPASGNRHIIYELNNQLNKIDNRNDIFKELNESLKKQQISLKDLLNEEYKKQLENEILISNIFKDLHLFLNISKNVLYNEISQTEKLLLTDFTYRNMTLESKNLYRHQVIKLARKKHCSEIDFLKKYAKDKNFGEILLNNKQNIFLSLIYLLISLVLSLTVTFFLSKYFLPWQLLSYLILFLPILSITTNFLHFFLGLFLPKKNIPRIDLSSLETTTTTMVTMASCIENKEELKEKFSLLEKYFLLNKTPNLYFTLQIITSPNIKNENIKSTELSKYGIKYVEKLNKKYNCDIFNFIYYKNNKKYTTFKQKTLFYLSKILLNKKIDENKIFYVNTLHNKKFNIKYLLTTDTNINLGLNTILDLVGTVEHPLNKPVYNKKKTKLISGYGIIQPSIKLDVETLSKDFYTKNITSAILNKLNNIEHFHQAIFKECRYIKVGLINLQVLETMTKNSPSNFLNYKILGQLLRPCYAKDIEVYASYSSPLELTALLQNIIRNKIETLQLLLSRKKTKKHSTTIAKINIISNIFTIIQPFILLFIFIYSLLNYKKVLFIFVIYISMLLTILTINKESLKVTLTSLILLLIDLPNIFALVIQTIINTFYSLIKKENLSSNITKTTKQNKLIVLSLMLLFLGVGLLNKNKYLISISIIYIILLIIMPLIKKNYHSRIKISKKDLSTIKKLAYDTWKFYETNLLPENNYLLPTRYEENKSEESKYQTTPTDIAFSMLSIISATKLGYLETKDSLNLLSEILSTITNLDKWKGHLYDLYDIKTLEVMSPKTISTKNSGFFVATLLVVQEYLAENNASNLSQLVATLIKNTNFKKLLSKDNLFYTSLELTEEGVINKNKVTNFVSTEQLSVFVALCLQQIPLTTWNSLTKTSTKTYHKVGLIPKNISTYYINLLFEKNYSHTLLNDTYSFLRFMQKKYLKKYNIPWGLTDTLLEDIINSKTPQESRKKLQDKNIIIYPASSIAALELFPKDILSNLKKYKKLNMFGSYGLYTSYNYTNKEIEKTYNPTNQGMILVSLTNYLEQNYFKDLFYKNTNINAYEILLKEKPFYQPPSNLKITSKKPKKDHSKELITTKTNLSSLPEMTVLTNKNYSLIINDRGNSITKFHTTLLNTYSEFSLNNYGIFLYIKDLKTKNIWSNTISPTALTPDKYEVSFLKDKVVFKRLDNKLETKTEIILAKNYPAEIRKITFKNETAEDKTLELTSYMEPSLIEDINALDYKFSDNFFISKYDSKNNALIVKRKNISTNKFNNYLVNKMYMASPLEKYSYETKKELVYNNQENVIATTTLSNYTGENINPILSLRNTIKIPATSEKVIYLLIGYGKNIDQINDILRVYKDIKNIEEEFNISNLLNSSNSSTALSLTNIKTFNTLLKYFYQPSKILLNEEKLELLCQDSKTQLDLFKLGITGYLPIILIEISDISDTSFITDILKAYEYYKNNFIYIDVIIINNESSKYSQALKKQITDEIYRINTLNNIYTSRGSIKIINGNKITPAEKILLKLVSRINFSITDHKSLQEMIDHLQFTTEIATYEYELENNLITKAPKEKLMFDNGFGGFKAQGKEYVIYNNSTPNKWHNIITNEKIGSIITNIGSGYTYAYNQKEFKITEAKEESKSEGFRFNNKEFNPTSCIHGFGYTILQNETKELKKDLIQFVSLTEPIKIYLLTIKNKLSKKQSLNIEFWLNAVLGEDKISSYILPKYIEAENCLLLRNVFNPNYNNINVFISSSEKIISSSTTKNLHKSITVEVNILAKEEKTIAFILGCNSITEEVKPLLEKYTNVQFLEQELNLVKKAWYQKLSTFEVKTPNLEFDYLINGWLAYQTLTSLALNTNLNKETTITSYRNKIQNIINIILLDQQLAKKEILIMATHQFPEGDVLHTWSDANNYGLRSTYKDEPLWLIWATYKYLQLTNDYTILEEQLPYITGDKLSNYENHKNIIFSYTSTKDLLINHLKKALDLVIRELGMHNLPLIGEGDFTDNLNNVGIKGKGESIALGIFLYKSINEFVEISKKYISSNELAYYKKFNETLKTTINSLAWEKKYYIRAFFDNSDKLASFENSECKIDLTTQMLAIISDLATNKQIEKILITIAETLIDPNTNLVKNLTPPFSKSLNNPGKIMSYYPGMLENGGQDNTLVAWYIKALLKMGYTNEAYHIFTINNPIIKTNTLTTAKTYSLEPYVLASYISTSPNFLNKASSSWSTTSAGWFYTLALENILGLKIKGNKLKLIPQLPSTWNEFKVIYHYKNTIYNIEVIKNKTNKLIVDNKEQQTNIITLKDDEKSHHIILYI